MTRVQKRKVLGLQIQKLSERISEHLVNEAEGTYICIRVVFLTFKAEQLLPFSFKPSLSELSRLELNEDELGQGPELKDPFSWLSLFSWPLKWPPHASS